MAKTTTRLAKNYSCLNCGNTYSAFPPDDTHVIAKLSNCKENDSIEIKYECQNCRQQNTLHWDIEHWHFASA